MMHTKIAKINDAQSLKTAAIALGKGKTIVYPTETCYGLGADSTNPTAVSKIYKIKGRKEGKKISLACASLGMASKYVEINSNAKKLASAFMPGPMTIVTNGKSFRIPASTFALKLIRKFGRPITATSANISGKKNMYKIKDVIRAFDGKVDVIIDAGDLPARRASTVFNADSMQVLRKGHVTLAQIKKALARKDGRNYR